MVASLKKIDAFRVDAIYQPMLLGDAPGPTSLELMLERFRFSDLRDGSRITASAKSNTRIAVARSCLTQ